MNIKLNQSNTKRYVEEVMQLLKPKVWVNRDTHKLYGVVPVMVLEDEYNIQTENNAIFFVEYDLQWINQQVYRNLFNSLRLNLLLLVLTALSLGYYFHVTISKRIRSIIKMAKSYQKWGYLQELAVDGHDEITDLAFSFMEMVRQIELQYQATLDRQKRLQVILDSIADGVIATDNEGCISHMNSVAVQKTGWSARESQGLKLDKVYHRLDGVTETQINLESIKLDGVPNIQTRECQLLDKGGHVLEIIDRITPIMSADNQVSGFVVVFTDISKRKHIEDALRASEEKFRTITVCSSVGMFLSDAKGNLIYINAKCAEIIDIPPSQILHKSWRNQLHPEDKQRVLDAVQKAQLMGLAFNEEYRWVHADGTVIWTKGEMVSVLGKNNEVISYIGTLTDITQQKLAEQALVENSQRLLETQHLAHIGCWEYDFINHSMWWSDQIFHLIGRDKNNTECTVENYIRYIHEIARNQKIF